MKECPELVGQQVISGHPNVLNIVIPALIYATARVGQPF